VYIDLSGKVPLILDSGPCEIGVESTVLDLCSDNPRILRPGGISLEALRTILPEVQPPVRRNTVDERGESLAMKAPGQLNIHYAPKVPLLLFDGTIEEMHASMLTEIEHRHAKGERVGILAAEEDIPTFQDTHALVYSAGSDGDLMQVAAHLFAGLRYLEEANVRVILCRQFGEQGLGLAIRDRLLKAAGGKFSK
jgi:L-threonylcarbamoyladenylate synthase